MKYILTLLAVVAVAALCAVAVVHFKKSSTLNQQVSALSNELSAKQEQLKEAESARQRSEQQERQLIELTGDMDKQLKVQQQAISNAATRMAAPSTGGTGSQESATNGGAGGAAGFGKMLAKLMEDPDAKKLIRDQQKLVVDQLYAPLIRQLGLTETEATQFKELLSDGIMKATENATAVLGGAGSATRAETTEKLASAQKQLEGDVKAFLGEDRYATYKEYQLTAGERAQLNVFRQQTAGSANAIDEAQVEQLLSIMKEEKQSYPALANQQETQSQAFGSQEQVDSLLQAQEAMMGKVRERASGVLSAGQLDTFGKFQTQQLQMMKLGINMARKMMAPEQTEAAPATSN